MESKKDIFEDDNSTDLNQLKDEKGNKYEHSLLLELKYFVDKIQSEEYKKNKTLQNEKFLNVPIIEYDMDCKDPNNERQLDAAIEQTEDCLKMIRSNRMVEKNME